MDTKFTKGEWFIDVWETMLNVNTDNGEVGICEIEVDGHKGSSGYKIKPTTEQKANAHLIASAPDMYEMLKGLLGEHLESDVKNEIIETLKKARGE